MVKCNTKLCVCVMVTVLCIVAVSVIALSVRERFEMVERDSMSPPTQVGGETGLTDSCNPNLGIGYLSQTPTGIPLCNGASRIFMKDMEFGASLGSLGKIDVKGDIYVKNDDQWIPITKSISEINNIYKKMGDLDLMQIESDLPPEAPQP